MKERLQLIVDQIEQMLQAQKSMKQEKFRFEKKDRESIPTNAPFENVFKKLFKALLVKKLLKKFENYKTYNTPEFLEQMTDKFSLLHSDLNVTWDDEMEQRRRFLNDFWERKPG
jgi:hypothetical protein